MAFSKEQPHFFRQNGQPCWNVARSGNFTRHDNKLSKTQLTYKLLALIVMRLGARVTNFSISLLYYFSPSFLKFGAYKHCGFFGKMSVSMKVQSKLVCLRGFHFFPMSFLVVLPPCHIIFKFNLNLFGYNIYHCMSLFHIYDQINPFIAQLLPRWIQCSFFVGKSRSFNFNILLYNINYFTRIWCNS